MSRTASAALLVLLLAAPTAAVEAQDGNIMAPVETLERRLATDTFQIIDRRASRGRDGERTSRTALSYSDGAMLVVKWARSAPDGEAFNNSPRFELAAYQIQKLFLDESDYVVPPTVARAFPVDLYQELDPADGDRAPTFRGTRSTLAVLQYWLYNVSPNDFWDQDRFQSDSLYARHLGNFNVLSYLIHHLDANEGNFLISTIPDNPRVFSVDNGVAFSSVESDRGSTWRRLRVERLPAGTVQRLRRLTRRDLERSLGTVAEFRVLADGTLEAVSPTASMNPRRGVRQSGDRVQLGLTRSEIDSVWNRLRQLMERVDGGRMEVF